MLTKTHAHLLPACLPALASAPPSPNTLQRFDESLQLSLETSVENSIENSDDVNGSASSPAAAPTPTPTVTAAPTVRSGAAASSAQYEEVATALEARLRAEGWGGSSGCRVFLFGSAVLESDMSAVRDLDLCAVTTPGWVPPAPPPPPSLAEEAPASHSTVLGVKPREMSLGQGTRGGKGNSSSSSSSGGKGDRDSAHRHRKLNEPMARLVESAHAVLLRTNMPPVAAAATINDETPPCTDLQLSSFRTVSHARVPVLKFDASLGAGSSSSLSPNKEKATPAPSAPALMPCDLVANNGAALLNTALQHLCFQRSPSLRKLWRCVRKWITGRSLVGETSDTDTSRVSY